MLVSVLDALRDAINSHDPHRVAACFTPDFQQERPLRPQEAFVGNDHVAENWTKLLDTFPDLRAEILRHARNGDEIWSEWEMRATTPAGAPTLLCGPVVLTTRPMRTATELAESIRLLGTALA